MDRLPLNDAIAIAVSRLVDDSRLEKKREPTHYYIGTQFERANLSHADPQKKGANVGKTKRIQAVLTWAIDNDIDAGERLVYLILSLVKSVGGFREDSPNFVGKESIQDLRELLRSEGFTLSSDGEISKVVLENLNSTEKFAALKAYSRRAVKGVDDAALLVGTSKDLMEAVAAFILEQRYGSYSTQSNFPTLLGQAFVALGLESTGSVQPNEPAQKRVERALYELACSINKLRNKEGTGHGRPFLSSVTDGEAKMAIESIGLISEFLLNKLSI